MIPPDPFLKLLIYGSPQAFVLQADNFATGCKAGFKLRCFGIMGPNCGLPKQAEGHDMSFHVDPEVSFRVFG